MSGVEIVDPPKRRRKRSKINGTSMDIIYPDKNGKTYKVNPNAKSEFVNFVRKAEEKEKVKSKYEEIREDAEQY